MQICQIETEFIKQKRDKFRQSCRKEDIESRFKIKRTQYQQEKTHQIQDLMVSIESLQELKQRTKDIQRKYKYILTSLLGKYVQVVPQDVLQVLTELIQIMPYKSWKINYDEDLSNEVKILFSSLISFEEFPDSMLIQIFEIIIWIHTKFYKERSILDFIEYMFIKFNNLKETYFEIIRDKQFFGFKSIDKIKLIIENDQLPESSQYFALRYLYILLKFRDPNDRSLCQTLINIGLIKRIKQNIQKHSNLELNLKILLSLATEQEIIALYMNEQIPQLVIQLMNHYNYKEYLQVLKITQQYTYEKLLSSIFGNEIIVSNYCNQILEQLVLKSQFSKIQLEIILQFIDLDFFFCETYRYQSRNCIKLKGMFARPYLTGNYESE